MEQEKFSPGHRRKHARCRGWARHGIRVTDTPNSSAVSVGAVPTPTVAFSFTQQTVNSGIQPELTYRDENLPAGSEIFLQLAHGTPTQWDFVKS